MKIHYIKKIEGSPVVQFVAEAWCALMKHGQWDKTSVLIGSELQCVYATVGKRTVGCLTFHIDGSYSTVNCAYVVPAFRSKGVYQKMHERFVELSRQQSATSVLNICYPSNEGIQAACKKLGYLPYTITLKLAL